MQQINRFCVMSCDWQLTSGVPDVTNTKLAAHLGKYGCSSVWIGPAALSAATPPALSPVIRTSVASGKGNTDSCLPSCLAPDVNENTGMAMPWALAARLSPLATSMLCVYFCPRILSSRNQYRHEVAYAESDTARLIRTFNLRHHFADTN